MELSMEQRVMDLLRATLQPDASVRTDAEIHLQLLYTTRNFPHALISLASHEIVPVDLRQAALLSLKKLILKSWSPVFEEFEGPFQLDDVAKEQIRHAVLSIATSGNPERKVVGAASYVVSKIASADFPEAWPTLLPTLLQLVPQSDDARLHGVLVVLGNLVEDGFDEDQFSESAVALVRCLYEVATDAAKKLTARAMAVSIFRACFDTMQLVYQNNKTTVKQFMQESSDAWLPFFVEVLNIPLPSAPSEEDEQRGGEAVVNWRGVIALKTQVVKVDDGHRADLQRY
jgi:importin-9